MKKLLYYIIPALLLSGCSKEPGQQQEQHYDTAAEVTFVADIESMQNSSSLSGWVEKDRIGLYMLKHGTTSVINNSRNRAYTLSGTDKFTGEDGQKIYFLANEMKVDFIAYYPYQSALKSYTYHIDISNQNAPHNIDLLHSSNIRGVSQAEQRLTFTHQLSLLSMAISAGDGLSQTELAGIKVVLKEVNTMADFNLMNYTISNERQKDNVVAISATDGLSSQAIIIPSTLQLALELTLANDVKFEWVAEKSARFYPGTEYSLNVVVGASGVDVTLSAIGDWGGAEREPIEGEGEVVTPPVAKTYAVGDLYPTDTEPIGVVFQVSNNGANGKVVSLVDQQNRWGDTAKDESTDGVQLIRDENTGYGATRNLINIRKGQGNFDSDYNIFSWIYKTMNNSDIDGQWYLPAKNELMALYAAMSGLTYADVSSNWTTGTEMPNFATTSAARDAFNNKIKAAGGTKLNLWGQYWSSTEIAADKVWSIHFQTSVLQNTKLKGDTWGAARPIMSF